MTPAVCILAAALAAQPDVEGGAGAAPQPQPFRFLEGYPPGAQRVPGLPGAMVHPDVPEGYVLIDGDIQVREADYRDWLMGTGTFGGVSFWGSTIPFTWGPGLDNSQIQAARAAMDAISARANISFVSRSGESDWIIFMNSTGNNSAVGRQGGPQVINIHDWLQFIIVHELYHAVGFHHEQSRHDRDTYVTIHLQNVCQDCCSGETCNGNFAIRSNAAVYGPYDFDSITHYPDWAFSTNGLPTITVNQPFTAQWQSAIGQRDHFSTFDELTCRGIYRFASDRWWKPGASGNGSGNLANPLPHATFAGAYSATPAGGVLFIKDNAAYSAVGVYSTPMTIRAPMGAVLRN